MEETTVKWASEISTDLNNGWKLSLSFAIFNEDGDFEDERENFCTETQLLELHEKVKMLIETWGIPHKGWTLNDGVGMNTIEEVWIRLDKKQIELTFS